MKTIRVGMIGCGGINATHVKWLGQSPGVVVAAVCGRDHAKATAFAAEHAAGATVYDDWRRMIADEPLDAVYIALPPGANVGQAEAVAERGLHLMLEKPIALSMERAESIAAAVRRAGVHCQIGHHMRHATPVVRLKEMLADGSAGKPLLMQGRFFINGLFPAWWRDPQMGGGQLVEQAIHIYGLARHFLGEPVAVSAQAGNLHHQRFADYQVDDVSASTIRFQGGAIASLCASNCAEPRGFSKAMTVQCEDVAVEFKNADEATFTVHGGKKSEEVKDETLPKPAHVISPGSPYEALTANFIATIRGEATMRSTIEDGVGSLRLVLAAAESAKAGGQLVTLGAG